MNYFLAVDLGTTGCRSIIFDQALNLIADSYREYPLVTPRDNWAEQNANHWWELTLETGAEAIKKSGIDAHCIDGISISSQGITIVPVDEKINPLYPAITWLDTRTEEEVAEIAKTFSPDEIFRHTGKPLAACYTLPKLLWLQKYTPEIYASAYKFLMPMEFLVAKFTGRCITDHSMASGTLLYDIHNQCWSEKILKTYNIDPAKLPELGWSGENAGCVLPEVAQALGLRPDCVVGLGAQDQKCAALGVGLKSGMMTVSLGTACAIEKYWTYATPETVDNIPWSSFTAKGTWVTEGVINAAATCFRWLRDTMFPGESFDVLTAEALEARNRGSNLYFYPYMAGTCGPHYYPGATGCFHGATLATTRGDFALAVMEGIAFQIRSILEAMQATDETLILFGGGSKGPIWCQIIADATKKTLCVPVTSEAAGAGAAILAGQAAGTFTMENPPAISTGKTYLSGTYDYEEKYKAYRMAEEKIFT